MSDSEYNFARRCGRWLRRWRHRCGYGVHSPYAFRFVTGVVYEAAPYYAYADLRDRLQPAAHWLMPRRDAESGLSEKDLRLLFRLANFCRPRRMVLCGASETTAWTLRAAVPHARQTALHEGIADDDAGALLIYADDAGALPGLPGALPAGSMVVVRGIHRGEAAERRWKALVADEKLTLTFDLGRLGIALRTGKMVKQHYEICYF